VPVSPLYTSLFQMLGAAPTSINLGEAYSALQTKIVDAQENPLVVFDTAKFYEVQKYISFTNHVWDGSWILANGAAWRALPKDLQDIVAKNINEQGLAQRADSADLNNTLQAELKQKGIIINTPDQAPFREALRKAGFYKQWAEKYGAEAWGILEKSVGQLT
jgi:TRAP-type C4-dicarboxylate transport system substrate-binding protein